MNVTRFGCPRFPGFATPEKAVVLDLDQCPGCRGSGSFTGMVRRYTTIEDRGAFQVACSGAPKAFVMLAGCLVKAEFLGCRRPCGV